MERRILGIRIPELLPRGVSVSRQTIDTSPGPKELSGQEKLQARILEALDSYSAEGIPGQSGYYIIKRIEEIHPPKHWWNMIGHGTIYRALDGLKEKGLVKFEWVPYSEDQIKKGAPDNRPVYSRVIEPQEAQKA